MIRFVIYIGGYTVVLWVLYAYMYARTEEEELRRD